MITTAVQQASQMVEIQGAPSTVQADGGDFRETFAANVSSPAVPNNPQSQRSPASDAATSGGSSTKLALTAGLPVKSASAVSNAATQSLLKLNDAASEEDSATAVIASASSSSLKIGTELNAGGDASMIGNNLRRAVLTPVSDVAQGKTSGLAAAAVPPVLAGTGAATLKDGDLGKSGGESVDGTAAKGHKSEASYPSKGASFARAEAIAPGTSFVPSAEQAQLIASLEVASPQIATDGGGPIAQMESEPGVLTGALQASDVSGSTSANSTLSGVASAGVSGVSGLQNDGFESAGAKGTGATTVSTERGKDGLKSEQIGDAAPQFADGAATARSLDGVGVNSSAASGAVTAPLSKVTDAGSVSGWSGTGVKAAVSTLEPGVASFSQATTSRTPHSAAAAQTFHPAQAFPSNAVGAVQDASAKVQGSEPGLQRTSIDASQTNGVLVPVQGAANLPLQVDVVREAAPVSASLRAGPSKAEGVPAKDDKTKAGLDGAGDAGGSATVPAVAGDTSIALSSPVASAASVAGRVIPAGDAAVPVALATPHTAGPTAHAVGGSAESAVAARVQGGASAGPVAESNASGAQAGESHRTLLATPTTLEVGVQSGTQGWLRIRAEVGEQGAVNASLAAGSSGSRELLHSQMPALNAFLHSEQIAVATTVVDRGTLAGAASGSGGLFGQDGGGSNGSLLQGGGAQSDGARQDSSQQAVRLSAGETVKSYDALTGVSGVDGPSPGRASVSEGSGRWLNVRV